MQVIQKTGNAFVNGIPCHVPNEIMQDDPSFYISYNPSCVGYGCQTTALVLESPQTLKFLILKGDHRKQYKEANTLDACLQYYADNPDLQHAYSDKL